MLSIARHLLRIHYIAQYCDKRELTRVSFLEQQDQTAQILSHNEFLLVCKISVASPTADYAVIKIAVLNVIPRGGTTRE